MIINPSKYRKSILFVVSILVLGLSGCATTHKTRNAKQSGFLGDYSEFENFASMLAPYGGLVSKAKRITIGTELFVGRAAIELEMLDALSNRRIVAAIEGRSGTKTLHRGFS